jgi:hypothetical protein
MAREAEKKTFSFLFTKPLQESHYLICSLAVSLLHCTILYSATISLYALILWLFIPSGNLQYVFPFIGSNLLLSLFVGSVFFFFSCLAKSRLISLMLCFVALSSPVYFKLIGIFPDQESFSVFERGILAIAQSIYLYVTFAAFPFLVLSVLTFSTLSWMVIRWKRCHTLQGTRRAAGILLGCAVAYYGIFTYAVQNTNITPEGFHYYGFGQSPMNFNPTGASIVHHFWDRYEMSVNYTLDPDKEIENTLDISHIRLSQVKDRTASPTMLLDRPLRDCFPIADIEGELIESKTSRYGGDAIALAAGLGTGLLKTNFQIQGATDAWKTDTVQLLTHLDWRSGEMRLTPVQRVIYHFSSESSLPELRIDAIRPGIFDENQFTSIKEHSIQTITEALKKKSGSESHHHLMSARIFFFFQFPNLNHFNYGSSPRSESRVYWVSDTPTLLNERYYSVSYLDLSQPEEAHYYVNAYTVPLPTPLLLPTLATPSTTVTEDALLILIQQNWQRSLITIRMDATPPYSPVQAKFHPLPRSIFQNPVSVRFFDGYNYFDEPRISYCDPALFVHLRGMVQVYSVDAEGKPTFFGRYFQPQESRYSSPFQVHECTPQSFQLITTNRWPAQIFSYRFQKPLPAPTQNPKPTPTGESS